MDGNGSWLEANQGKLWLTLNLVMDGEGCKMLITVGELVTGGPGEKEMCIFL